MTKIFTLLSVCAIFLCVASVSLKQLSNDKFIFRVKRDSDNIKSSIISKFNEINEDLKHLSNVYRQPVVRSASPSKCTLSMAKLKQFKDQIDSALTEHDQANSIDCDLNEFNPDGSCNEYVKYIQCGINHLKSAMSSATSDKEVMKVKLQYQKLLDSQKKFFDDHMNELDEKHKIELDELKTKMQELMGEFTKMQDHVYRDVIKKISKTLNDDEVLRAVEEFKEILNLQLDFGYVASKVVENYEYYSEFNLDIVVFTFLKKLPAYEYSNKGYDKAIEKYTNKHGELNEKTIIRYYVKFAPFLEFRERHRVFKNKFEDAYMKVVDRVAKAQDCDEFSSISNAVLEKYFIEDFVMKAYSDVRDFDKVTKCLSDVRDSWGYAMGLPALYELMMSKNELDNSKMNKFACFVKEALDFVTDRYSTNHMEILETLKNKLPENVKQNTWNSNGNKCIEN